MIEEELLYNERVRHSSDGHIPFEDEFFSLVVSNQVFEHVHDIDLALSEISRVLVPGGSLVALFPTREVFREGHIGIPMSHWWPAGSRGRSLWVKTGRTLGLGYNKSGKSIAEWTRDSVDYLDNWTVYRSLREIKTRTATDFALTNAEQSYIRFRLRKTRAAFLEATTRWPVMIQFQALLLRELMGRVLILTKTDNSRP
jgi:SAM-dependent methyltransferase